MTQSRKEAIVRLIAVIVGGILTAMAVATFVIYASSPTDENIFADPPMPMHVLVTPPASVLVSPGPEGVLTAHQREPLSAIAAGALLYRLNGRPMGTPAEVLAYCDSLSADSLLTLDCYLPAKGAYARVRAARPAFSPSTLAALGDFVIVTQITANGASDRAGMKVGDLILKINDKPFVDAKEADRILQSGEGGKALVYEIQRGKDRLTIPVVLAAFGFPLAALFESLAGLIAMGAGLFFILKRPGARGAAGIGWTLLALGFAASVLFIRRDPNATLFVSLRNLAVGLTWMGGTVLAARSYMLFPVELPGLLSRRWILYVAAAGAILSGALAVKWGNGPFYMGYAIVLLFLMVVLMVVYRKESTPERRRLGAVLRWTAATVPVAGLLIFVCAYLSSFAWSFVIVFVGTSMLMMTLAVIYTIGRYRLYDLDLRVRRNIRHSLSSALWGTGLAVLLIWGLVSLTGISLHVPSVLIHGASIEILDQGENSAGSEWTARVLLLGVGIAGFVGLSHVRKAGQSWIDRRYYRTHLDYRQAAQTLGRLLATTQAMSDLGRGLGNHLAELMKVTRAGVFFVHGGRVTGCEEACGVTRAEWGAFCDRAAPLLPETLEGVSEPLRVSLLPEPVRGTFLLGGFSLIVPVRSSSRLLGVLALGDKRSESPYSDEDFSFLASAARQTAVAMENAYLYEELAGQERLKHELTIARRIQMASLPQTTPIIPGLDIAGESVPAMEVGGDFYDYLVGSDGKLFVVVGDVSGKGTSAALYMAKVQGILRSLHEFHLTPREMFVRANSLLNNDLEKSSFVTAIGVQFDPGAHSMRIARAGHLPLYHYRKAEGRVDRVVPRGLGLAISDAATFAGELEERILTYGSGDLMLLVTDGLTEARNGGGEEFGEEIFDDILRSAGSAGASEIRDEVLARIRRFAGDAPHHDDETLVVIRAA